MWRIMFRKYNSRSMFAHTDFAACVATFFLLSTTPVLAGDSTDGLKLRIGTGNPVAGKEKSLLCQGCHGEDGNSPTPESPKIAGQYAAYIQKQIRDYQSGIRQDPVMSEIAATVTNNQDLLDISAYFASQEPMKPATPISNPAGKARFMSGMGCISCHVADSKNTVPIDPLAPVLGGQYKDYLVKQIKAFKDRSRNNDKSGMMFFITSSMSDRDIEDVSEFASGL